MDQARILQLLLYIHLWVVSTDKSIIQKYYCYSIHWKKKRKKKEKINMHQFLGVLMVIIKIFFFSNYIALYCKKVYD